VTKYLVAALVASTLLLSAFGSSAEAQDACAYNYAIADYSAHIACAVPYPGPFDDVSAPAVVVTAPAATPAPVLALTGSETSVLAYVGSGLIAFGAAALGSRRKFLGG
jgi:LPXTG-motif cell wall-anchored protein